MTERTYTADEVDAMIARAVAAARPPNTLHFAQWTNEEKDLSNYILVGSLTLAGIEDNEYGQSEIDSLENTIEALQERLVTGSEHKKVPLLAYIGGLNTTPPAQPATKESLETQTASAYVKTYHGGKPWPLQPAPLQDVKKLFGYEIWNCFFRTYEDALEAFVGKGFDFIGVDADGNPMGESSNGYNEEWIKANIREVYVHGTPATEAGHGIKKSQP